MIYRVVSITNNVEGYPESAADTAEFPEMVKYVKDEHQLFVVDQRRQFWPADEFFYMIKVTQFTA